MSLTSFMSCNIQMANKWLNCMPWNYANDAWPFKIYISMIRILLKTYIDIANGF